MLKGENIICISSIDWDFIWQGHQEIMTAFARNGNRVLFIENTGVRSPGIRDIPRIRKRIKNWFRGTKGIRKEMENLYIYSPIVLPFPYLWFSRWINRHLVFSILERWIRIMDFSDPIVWTFLPTPLSVDIIDNLIKKLVVYYCIDNFSMSSVSANKIKKSEIRLLKKMDMVFVTSKPLYDYCLRYNNKVYSFPFAVNFEYFKKVRQDITPGKEELLNIRRPLIGYVGGIHKWIDLPLIKKLAKKFDKYSFVFVGPLQRDVSSLYNLTNVHFFGNKDHKELPFFIKEFDACLIPYLISDYTINVYPTKLNEYLAMGKPVISTHLPEVIAFNTKYDGVVYVAKNPAEFENLLDKALKEDSELLKNKRIEVSQDNNWADRIEKMSDLIIKEIEYKRMNINARWKENLKNFYWMNRRRAVKAGAVCFMLFFILFKTPFMWFLADPLKLSDQLRKADAIVIFGGGVGETGSPGKSTIERARYASQLYALGYADKIIFSSGYAYTYNDAENMRLIALSMGVSDRDIILEKKANSAYENVIYTREILAKNNWHSILLVSAPYNMRRVNLVYRKLAKDIKVTYVPVMKCQFYEHGNTMQFEQLRAIMHEYLGILYYWIKGYI